MNDAATLSPAAPRPAHVPEGALYDFDMFRDPAYLADPHKRILDLIRMAPPVFWTPRNGGHWMFLSHNANFKASRDTESFTSQFVTREQLDAIRAKMPPGTPHIPMASPINLDPPEHGQYRAPLQQAFSPKAMLALKGDIRTLANQLIDSVITRGRCDFMVDIAEPLPVRVFLKMLGLPLERQEEYRALVREHLSDPEPDPRKVMMKLLRITAMMRDTILERRERPQNDLISLLWKSQINGRPTTLEDMENYGVVLFIAGLDTVMNGMGFGIRHLAQDQALQSQLRANPKIIPEAAEELLRRYTFTVPPRKVAKDVVFEGLQMRAGERVMLFLPAADLDPAEFTGSDRFDLTREKKAHIAFNTGPHRCLGSHLARVELQTLYEQMLARLPQFRLDPERPPKFHGGHVI
ncbi:MAG TPA: cytochrome P450, partial [Steroidobacteraceae bacterium]|nr:cytochrome P450 [Steroidobacteraceae bacterium]